MATVSIDNFLPDVMQYVPGVPYPLAVKAVRDAAQDLCSRSLICQSFDTGSTLSANATSYSVTAPASYAVVRVIDFFVDKKRVEPVPANQLGRYLSVDWPLMDAGTPIGWFMDGGVTIRIVPKLNASYSASAWIATRPSDSAIVLDDILAQDWMFEIRDGACAKLFGMPNQPWSSEKQEEKFMRRFRAAIGDAIIEANRGRANSQLAVSLPTRP